MSNTTKYNRTGNEDMTLEELREAECVGNWYRPYARSTYMKMTKSELVEHLKVAFQNWLVTEEFLKRSSDYAKRVNDALKHVLDCDVSGETTFEMDDIDACEYYCDAISRAQKAYRGEER